MGAARHSTRVEKLFLEIVNVAIFCPISHDVGEQPGPHSSEKRAAAQGKAEPISHDLSGDEPLRSPHAAPLLPLRRVGSPLSGSHRGGRCSGSPPSLHTRRTLWRRCGPSEVPRRQPEQRWSLAMDGAKQPDPRAREKRVVTQSSPMHSAPAPHSRIMRQSRRCTTFEHKACWSISPLHAFTNTDRTRCVRRL